MKGKKYGSEQIIPILREAAGGKAVGEVCREHNISEVTFHRWKKKYGHLDIQDAKRLKELERENTELKKILADQLLQIRVLEVACEKKL
ncbi:MAG: transposase [Spirochaetia bacterium]|nr:transposase [Spirochaetia bacterium]